MPIARINDKLILFVHVPKAAGSTIVSYLRAKGPVAAITKDKFAGSRISAQHLHRELYDQLFPRPFYDHGFCVLRDPVERMVSEFKYRAQPVQRRPIFGAPDGAYAFKVGKKTKLLDFDGFVEFALASVQRDPKTFGNHFRPQVEFVHEDHHLFLFEDGMSQVFDWIDNVTETPAGQRDIHAKRSTGVAVSVSDQSRDRIRQFYKDDVALIEAVRARR